MLLSISTSFGKLRLCQIKNSKIVTIHSVFQHKFINENRFFSNVSKMNTFKGKEDRFNGVTINSEEESCDSNSFKDVLERSLSEWTDQQKRGIWFKVNIKQSDWIPALTNCGFNYHHAQNDYVMLFKWLPKGEICNIPPYAHTMMGVGAVVVNDNDEVLVVKEKYIDRPHWKLPGGYVNPGENLVDAAIREVYEETNIPTDFNNILSFRHGHGGLHNCSDLYTVVSLKPKSLEIKRCEREIEDSKWMKIDEYLTHPLIHELNRYFLQKYLENKRDQMKIECTHGFHKIMNKPYTLYHAISDAERNKL